MGEMEKGNRPETEALCLRLLEEELIPALGCTEPIAIAYAGARARAVLGRMPERLRVSVSGNILKNVKSVIVPNTGGRRGIRIAAVAGAVAGNADRVMQVLESVRPADVARCEALLRQPGFCRIRLLDTPAKLHVLVEAFAGDDSAAVEIRDTHTNIVRIERNGRGLPVPGCAAEPVCEREDVGTGLTLADVLTFADTVSVERLRAVLGRQAEFNYAIAEEGLSGDYGLGVGKTMLERAGDDALATAACYASAASDARMSGCTLPVVINSGSGNQGLTASLPVIVYARRNGISEERMLRALAVSNLVTICQKRWIGSLSAYCGAVPAACGSAAGIAYLDGEPLCCIEGTVENALADIAGMVCDGAKPSCAAKIYSALQTAFLGYALARRGRVVRPGDGLIGDNADVTLERYGRLAREGMRETDQVILNMMLGDDAQEEA